MLPSIAHVDIGEFKNTFKYLETPLMLTHFGSLLYPIISVRSNKNYLTVPRKMPDVHKIGA